MEAASDFATSLNVMMGYPQVKAWQGGDVTLPMSPTWMAAILRRDAQVSNPYKAAWNRELVGIRGTASKIGHRDGDETSESNVLCQAGLGTIIENKLLWAPFSTATDPTTTGYRSIKRIRTRRSIEKSLLRSMRAYNAQDLGPHLATLIYESLSTACAERVGISALIDYELIWARSLNSNTLLRDGGLRVKMRFEETPELVDLGIYTEPQPEAYDILFDSISAALGNLGDQAIRIAA